MIVRALSPVLSVLRDCRLAFWSVALFSGVVNLLMLAGPLYMLQVYDRVLASHSVQTLIALSVLLAGAYVFQAFLDFLRSRIVVRLANLFDRRLTAVVHRAVIRLSVQSRQPGEAQQPIRDLDQVRAFLTGAGPIAIVDLPWIPVFLALCFVIHPWIGMLSLGGAAFLIGVTLMTERDSRAPSRALAVGVALRSTMAEATRRNSDSVTAMGFADAMTERWRRLNDNFIVAAERSSDVIGAYGSLTKSVRLILQSAILGLGAYLVICGEMAGGAMIAASIMMSRALAPVETAIANWRGFVAARDSLNRLSDVPGRDGGNATKTKLPSPSRSLDVEGVTVGAPSTRVPIVRNVAFCLSAGEVLGILGPSGSGKTSLMRALAGLWPPAVGSIRLDGAALDQWMPAALGPHLGYVPQVVELFEGTVAENIARMVVEPVAEQVVRAAQSAGAHEMILRLPQGYDTRVGDQGAVLSGGQRQRIALARAFYGDPFLLLLDEANANLDSDGEAALLQAVRSAKDRGALVIMIAHRLSTLGICDKLLVLRDGAQIAVGARDDVLLKIRQPAIGNLKVVFEKSSGSAR